MSSEGISEEAVIVITIVLSMFFEMGEYVSILKSFSQGSSTVQAPSFGGGGEEGGDIRDLKQTMMAMRTSLKKRFNEQNNSSAGVL